MHGLSILTYFFVIAKFDVIYKIFLNVSILDLSDLSVSVLYDAETTAGVMRRGSAIGSVATCES